MFLTSALHNASHAFEKPDDVVVCRLHYFGISIRKSLPARAECRTVVERFTEIEWEKGYIGFDSSLVQVCSGEIKETLIVRQSKRAGHFNVCDSLAPRFETPLG